MFTLDIDVSPEPIAYSPYTGLGADYPLMKSFVTAIVGLSAWSDPLSEVEQKWIDAFKAVIN